MGSPQRDNHPELRAHQSCCTRFAQKKKHLPTVRGHEVYTKSSLSGTVKGITRVEQQRKWWLHLEEERAILVFTTKDWRHSGRIHGSLLAECPLEVKPASAEVDDTAGIGHSSTKSVPRLGTRCA